MLKASLQEQQPPKELNLLALEKPSVILFKVHPKFKLMVKEIIFQHCLQSMLQIADHFYMFKVTAHY